VNNDGTGDVCQLFDPDEDGVPDNGGSAPCPDGVTEDCNDNCPDNYNPDQSDVNNDTIGDACQPDDTDSDGIPDDDDNCPLDFNPDQSNLNYGGVDDDGSGDACEPGDTDGDGIPDDGGAAPCGDGETVDCDDNCRFYPNPDQANVNASDNDFGDLCEPGDFDDDGKPDDDSDGDGVIDPFDNCPLDENPDQSDFDDDWVGDVCEDSDDDSLLDSDDNCPATPNTSTRGTCSAGLVGLTCTTDPDCDFDTTPGVCSNDQEDADTDGVGDLCDNCPGVPNSDQSDVNGDGIGDVCQPEDLDGDGWPDSEDNCPDEGVENWNPDQTDTDGDGDGDACDLDDDGDDEPDVSDNCVTTPNASLLGTCTAGLVGDPCTTRPDCDFDTDDGVCSNDQEDSDSDGVGDVCDNCATTPNGPDQGTCTADKVGDPCVENSACDLDPDSGLGVCSLGQENADGDLLGDVCDPTPVPEPGAMALLLSGLALLRALVWHRQRGRR